MLVTTHMLRQMLAEVNEDVSHSLPVQGRTGITTSNGNDVFLSTETITKVDGDTMITREGTKAKLYSPMPCLYWKCVSTPDKDGVITLRQPITGVFLNDGENAICLGVLNAELIADIGLDIVWQAKFLWGD